MILAAAPANDSCLALRSVSLSISWPDGDLPHEYSNVDSCKKDGWNYNQKDCPGKLTSGEVILPGDTTSQYTMNVLATDYQWVSTRQCRQSLCVLSACGILSFCHISLCVCVCVCLNMSLSVQFIFSLSLSLSGSSTLLHIHINNVPLHIPSNSAKCHMLPDDITHHTTGKSAVQIQKTP